jgi:AcrR family transcriptional regulator
MHPSVANKDQPAGGRGRPRVEGLDQRVLEATRASVATRGYDATTVDHIASRAGVSKGSIYRRWPSKGVLIYDACVATSDDLSEVIDSGDIRRDLIGVARLTALGYQTEGNEVVQRVLADAAADPELMELLRSRFFAPRSDAIIRRVELAVERGELTPGLDASLVPAVLNGTQQYLWGVRGRALDDAELAELVDMAIGRHLPG